MKTNSPLVEQLPIQFWLVAALTAAVVIIAVVGLSKNLQDEHKPQQGSVLIFDDTSAVLPHEIAQSRIRTLKEQLYVGVSTNTQFVVSRAYQRMQARMFFVAILAGLFSVALTRGSLPDGSHKRYLSAPAYLATVVMLMMYFFDVHMHDLDTRYQIGFDQVSNALTQLDSLDRAKDDHWCSIGPSDTLANIPTTRLERKLSSAVYPNLEQVVFYFVPLILLFVLTELQFWPDRPKYGFIT